MAITYGYATCTTTAANVWYTPTDTYATTGYITSGASTTDTTISWGVATTGGFVTYYGQGYIGEPMTPEQIEAMKASQKAWEAAQKVEAERRRKSERKATKLFASLVSKAAFKLYHRRKYHDVIGASGTRYRLRPGSMIEVMEGQFGDKVMHKYCIIPEYSHDLPAMDCLIAQMMLILSGDEGEGILKKTAIRHEVQVGPTWGMAGNNGVRITA